MLGPLEVWANGNALSLGTRKQRTVLALLAVNANRLVSLDELVDEVWPDAPPASAVANVRGYAGNLVRLLQSAEPGRQRLARRGAGYELRAADTEIDLLDFRLAAAQGREAARRDDFATAAVRLSYARERWGGPLLSGVSHGPQLQACAVAVEEEYLATVDQLASVHLALGEVDQAVALLRPHVAAHPLRERAQALLMRGLHRAGDVAGALAVYADARTALVNQLGIEPSRELQELHRTILRRHAELDVPVIDDLVPVSPNSVTRRPRELPPDLSHFVGRETEALQARDVIIPRGGRSRHRAAVVVFYGPGGSGKSSLAVHLAHEIADRFPDGQLYVDLLGSTPGLRPLSTVEVLHRLLGSLGVRDSEMPGNAADAVARLRTETADRRLLMVLDNANDGNQLAALLPASQASAVLITSRRPLSTLDADRRLRLNGLPTRHGLALLARLAGDVAIDEVIATRILDLCDHLPLAVRISAARLANRPDLSPSELAERLADGRRRLDELELDGLAVRSCIRVGYETLTSHEGRAGGLAARTFRVLGLLKVPHIGPEVVAAMLREPDVTIARAALDQLVSAGLVEPLAAGRYRLHDLVRLVAAERATEEDGSTARTEALHRGLAYYAGALRHADRILRPTRMSAVDDPPLPPEIPLPRFTAMAQARTWVEAELDPLVAVTEQASALANGSWRMAVFISDALWYYLHIRHDWYAARRLGMLALRVAENHGDPAMAASAHLVVGRNAAEFREWHIAVQNFERALEMESKRGSHRGVAIALNSLGIVVRISRRRSEALHHYSKAGTGPSFRLVRLRKGGPKQSQQRLLPAWTMREERSSAHWSAVSLSGGSSATWVEFGSALRNLAIVRCVGGDFAAAVEAGDRVHRIVRRDGRPTQQIHEPAHPLRGEPSPCPSPGSCRGR